MRAHWSMMMFLSHIPFSIYITNPQQAKRLYKKNYNACIKMIKEMTPGDLPRKPRKNKMKKVSVNIPGDKEIGDDIMFE